MNSGRSKNKSRQLRRGDSDPIKIWWQHNLGTRVRSQFVIQVNMYALDVVEKGTFTLWNVRQHLRPRPPGPPPIPADRRRHRRTAAGTLPDTGRVIRVDEQSSVGGRRRRPCGLSPASSFMASPAAYEWFFRDGFAAFLTSAAAMSLLWFWDEMVRSRIFEQVSCESSSFVRFLGGLRWFLQQRTVLFWILYGGFLLASVFILNGVDGLLSCLVWEVIVVNIGYGKDRLFHDLWSAIITNTQAAREWYDDTESFFLNCLLDGGNWKLKCCNFAIMSWIRLFF